MLIIRLQRTGKKNQADFRIVLAEKKSPVNKKFTEILGSYNPRKKYFQVKEERVQYWIGQHVQISPTVHNLLVTKDILKEKKVRAFNTPKKEKAVEAPAAATTTPAADKLAEGVPSTEAVSSPAPQATPAEVVAAKPEVKETEKAEAAAPEQPAV